MTLTERINENGDENNEPNDLTALLELARGVSFEDVENIVRDKDEFEKIESFFDLVKQNEADRNHDLNILSNEANQNDNLVNDECETSEQVDDVQLSQGKHLSNDIQKDDTSVSDMEHEGGANNLSDHDSTSIYTSNLDDASDSSDDVVLEREENFNEASFIPEPISARELPEETDEKINQKFLETDEHLIAEFERGYATALKELEGSVDEEKQNLRKLADTLFMVQKDISDVVENFLIERVKSVSESFVGEIIDSYPENLLAQIKKESKDFEKFNRNIHIELNELDALALQKSEDSADTLDIVANQDLKRGEYRLSGHQSLLSKRFEDK
jgi:flagellar biosynthesis/type III secretory pathway protein FliH